MANFERDKDDVRVYDGSEDDEDGEGSHLPVVIIIAILVLAAFGGVVWLAYNQGVARGRNEPVRLAATTESSSPGNGIKVYQQPAGAEDEDESSSKAAEPTPAATPAAPEPTPVVQATPPAAPVNVAQATPPAAKPQAAPAPAPAKPQPAPAKPQPSAALTPVKPQPQPPAVATQAPAQLGLAHPAPETPAAPKAAAPAPKAAAAAPKPVTPPKPTAVATAAPKAAAAGSYLLQIGAYKSETEAMSAWKTYQGKHSTLLAGFGPDVQKADLGDKGTWYRLRISSFADKDAAAALCERLKAQNGACFLAR